MVDWVSCRIPVRLAAPIAGGHTVVVRSDGEIETVTPHRLKVPGSWASSVQVRAVTLDELEVQGNPAKWLAGHNLWGSACPRTLLSAFLDRLLPLLGLVRADVLPGDLDRLQGVILTRLDLTAMWQLPARSDVLAWLRSAQYSASIPHRGRGVFREGTLLLGSAKGKAFTRWQVVCYSKGQEVAAHPLPGPAAQDEELRAWVDRQLRVEVRIGRHDLRDEGLRLLGAWDEAMATKVYQDRVSRITFHEARALDVSALPRHFRSTFRGWLTGDDLRSEMSVRTFYRHRNAIISAVGVDINLPPPPNPQANVIPLRRTLEAIPVGRPSFADRIDTMLATAA